MKIISKHGREEHALIYTAMLREDHFVEFVDSVEPGLAREKKWCIIVSTQFGCPVNCKICDAGGKFMGNLTAGEILSQIRFVINSRNGLKTEKLKVHFARMGEPLLNPNILDALTLLREEIKDDSLMPCIATVAPKFSKDILYKIAEIKNELYKNGKFQMQFSINTTDEKIRDEIMPIPKMSFEEISEFGEFYFRKGDRKINLNFALAKEFPVNTKIISRYFDPDKFLIKITPLNPTENAIKHGFHTLISYEKREKPGIVDELMEEGFDVIISIGAKEEIEIGSNCGQYIKKLSE
ncbi:MAG: radical SAM protein [Thermoplasmatales archaeon]|nr:radical SAM protein [Thermoplasmatales archaeon]